MSSAGVAAHLGTHLSTTTAAFGDLDHLAANIVRGNSLFSFLLLLLLPLHILLPSGPPP